MKKIPAKYISLAVCAAVFTLSVALSALLPQKNTAFNETVRAAVCNTYPHASEMLKSEGTALYIDGVLTAVSDDRAELEKAVDERAVSVAALSYPGADGYEIINALEYTEGKFLASEFTNDIDSAVEDSALSAYAVVTRTVDSVLESQTVYKDNTDLTEGVEKVLVSGSDGEVSETYRLTYDGGKLCGSTLLSSYTVTEPIDTVVERGVKLKTGKTFTSLEMFIMPYNGGISSEYGTRYLMGTTFHGGVDIAGKTYGQNCYGAAVMAAGDGVVVEAGIRGDFGNLIVIEHSNGIQTYYAHLSKISVKAGQTVSQCQIIGNIGATGAAEGPHLHFEVRLPDGNSGHYRVNPKYYIIGYSYFLR